MGIDIRRQFAANGSPGAPLDPQRPDPQRPDEPGEEPGQGDQVHAAPGSERPALLAARWLGRGREQAPPSPQRIRRPLVPEPQEPSETIAVTDEPRVSPHLAGLEEAKTRVHRRLIQELEASRLDRMGEEEARTAVAQAARQLLTQEMPEVYGLARDEVIAAVTDEVLGLGPIENMIRDASISEVMINAPDEIFFERAGRIHRANVRFRDAAHIMRIAERIVSRVGRRVDESSPMVDARLPDGSRVNIIIPPVAPKSPCITIRKFKKDKLKLEDLMGFGSITPEAVAFMRASVHIKRNIIVSGGTGSGKTTLLNALSGAIPDYERLVTIEDPTELRLQQPHVVTLEARPASIEGRGEVTQRDLVRNALRMRPDRIIIGEVRGGETFDMLQAMNTGHEGSMSTIHANRPREALTRLENMIGMSGVQLPSRAVRQQIAAAVNMIIQVQRMRDGVRRITHVVELVGMEGDIITTQDLFNYEFTGESADGKLQGVYRSSGLRPHFLPKAEYFGLGKTLLESI